MELMCYNKGCGKTYLEEENKDDSCVHHPGVPVFHDAYKGWSCCSKKSTDFTEFLNFKGCSVSKHSNVKPPEPVKPPVEEPVPEETKAPSVKKSLPRPSIDTPLTLLTPVLASSVAGRAATPPPAAAADAAAAAGVTTGTACKRGGCGKQHPDAGPCDHHPGYPVFHEGMKFWSCCNRKTADFDAFMEQAGCVRGVHLWTAPAPPSCRIDWHQTASHVVVSLFSRSYLPLESSVRLSPVRLQLTLAFPHGAVQKLDLQLNGVVSVEESRVDMFGTKVEVKLRKAEPGSWNAVGRDLLPPAAANANASADQVASNAVALEAIDLSDL